MRIYFKCGCGGYNYNLADWICHFKYNKFRKSMKYLLLTKIQFKQDFYNPEGKEIK